MTNKVTIIGAGSVGATVAYTLVAQGTVSEIVLIDVNEAKAKGEALDILQATPYLSPVKIYFGTYEDAVGSDIVIVTSGVGRKPGQSRIDLTQTNVNILKSIAPQIVKYAPDALYLFVANPVDVLTYVFHKITGVPKNRVIGMGGALDSSRFRCYLAKAANANIHDVDGMVIGGHGDTTMIPLIAKATIKGVPASQFLSKKKLSQVAADTMVGGATLTGLLGTSAWYAPGAAAASVVEAVLGDQKRIIPCSCYLEGEYGQEDIMIGVPAVIGRKGIEKIVKIDLNKEEQAQFEASAAAVRKVNQILVDTNAI